MTGSAIPFTGLTRQYNNLSDEILAATDLVLRSGSLMNGTFTDQFESWLATKNRTRYAATCHSGTQALEILAHFYAAERGINHKLTVGIPALTYAATANAFARAGWHLHFIDVDSHGVIDLTSLSDVQHLDALVFVGLYGAGVYDIGTEILSGEILINDITIIEDAAQHWLASDCRRLGHSAAISFDPMKNLPAYGNGGAIVTNDDILYDYAKSVCNNGKPYHTVFGTNSRMSELECAQILIKTNYLETWQQRRRQIAEYYLEHLTNVPVRPLINQQNISNHCFHKFVIDTDRRDELQKHLAQQGIESRVHYDRALHEMPLFVGYKNPGIICSASALSRRVLSLPIYPELSDSEVEHVVNQVQVFFSRMHK